jgi:sugar lactone lactonase YvrE
VEWAGALDAPQNGLYQLGLRAVTEAQLFLDDRLLVTTTAPDQYTEAAIALEAGLHDIKVRFKDSTEHSRIHLFWTTPNGQFEVIPGQNLWPPLADYPKRSSATVKVEAEPLRLIWLKTLGQPGTEPGQFFEARDLAVLPNGNLAVADTVNRRVQILTPQGDPIQVLTGDELPFEEPLAVVVNSRAEILILDSNQQWVWPAAYLFHPRGMAVLEDDTIVLADTGNARLIFFSPDGAQAGNIGGPGSGPGQFSEPTDVLRKAQGNYFVAEAKNNRIQQIDAAGKPLNRWAIPPAYALNGPHLAFAPDGSIFVTESQSKSLLRYAPDGRLLNQWPAIGPVNFAAPVGLYFDAATNRLYVTDVWAHQIYIFEVQTQ